MNGTYYIFNANALLGPLIQVRALEIELTATQKQLETARASRPIGLVQAESDKYLDERYAALLGVT